MNATKHVKKPGYIDRLIASEEFNRQAAEAQAHFARYFQTRNPAFAEALDLEQAIKLLHQGNKP